MNIEYKQDVTKVAEGQSLLNDGLGAWVNVDDRLPNLGQKVIAFRPQAHLSQDEHIVIARLMATAHKSPQGVTHCFDCWCHVTHWSPLLEAPNAEVRGCANTELSNGERKDG